jgi:hypothetical protein
MSVYFNASDAGIDTDEGRFVLKVWADEEGTEYTIDIHPFVLDFYAAVKSEIGPYAAEADQARRAVTTGMTREQYLATQYPGYPQPVTVAVEDVYAAIDAGYALDDPKHSTYHDRMSEVWDSREGK